MAFSEIFGPNTGYSKSQRQSGSIDKLRDMGRRGDTEVVHATPFTQALLKNMGGSGLTNPKTGLLEFAPLDPASWNDEDYLRINTDAAAAVASGDYANGWDHYQKHGRDEGRTISQLHQDIGQGDIYFDESDYLSVNTDVADAVSSGDYTSGLEHFLMNGQVEGRDGWQQNWGVAEEEPEEQVGGSQLESLLAALSTSIAGLGEAWKPREPQPPQMQYDPLAFMNQMGWMFQPSYQAPMIQSTMTPTGSYQYGRQTPGVSANPGITAPPISDARMTRRGGFGNAITF